MYKNYQSALRVLSKSDSVKLLIVAITQFGVAIFDLIGIILIGFLTTLSVYGIQSRDYDENTNKILNLLNLDKLSFQNQVATIGGIAVFVLIFKTIISTLITKKTILFISLKGAFISKKLLKNIFSSPINIINKFSTQQLVYSATSGVENLTTKLFGTSLAIFSDFALLIVIFLGLFMFNPITSLAIFTFFSLFATIINNITKHRAFSLGTQEAGLSVEINQDMYELINSYRELFVKNMKDPYLLNLVSKRFDLAKVNAKKLFLAPISKYIFEIALVMGCLLMCGVQFLLNDATAAITSLGIFLAATFRVAPAILRIQQGSMQIRNSLGTVETTIHLIDYFAQYENTAKNDNTEIKKIGWFNPEINVKNLEFKYNNEDKFTLNNLSFTIKPGSHVAIVGPSGSGKSTLLDLILGVLIPNSGDIRISGEIPIDAIKIWQGRIAYLPQSNFILNGNIAKNIALSNNISKSEEYSITEVLKIAQLDVFVHNLPQGIYTELGDKGFKLSGGQKQRLGIARALFTDPDLIIFDESTSSLDSNTENLISDALNKLNGKTILLVAHRLSSVKESDEIIYMENGSIKAIGSFDDVKRTVPNFDRQAKLLGL